MKEHEVLFWVVVGGTGVWVGYHYWKYKRFIPAVTDRQNTRDIADGDGS